MKIEIKIEEHQPLSEFQLAMCIRAAIDEWLKERSYGKRKHASTHIFRFKCKVVIFVKD